MNKKALPVRIISKFRDYYDSVQGVMYDSDMMYIRKQSEVKVDVKHLFSYGNYFLRRMDFVEVIIIGFCGEVYPILKLDFGFNSDDEKRFIKLGLLNKNNKIGDYYCLPVNQISDKLTDQLIQPYFQTWNAKKLISHINSLALGVKTMDLFSKNQTPIFLLRTKSRSSDAVDLTVAPCLADYGFQSVFDPYTALQELVMWIGNQAVNEWPPQIIDDVVLRDSKGFDKWSFKKRSPKKK